MAEDNWLDKAFETPNRPKLGSESTLSLRVFKSGTELKEAIHTELVKQLNELEGCPDPGCTYLYSTAVGFLG